MTKITKDDFIRKWSSMEIFEVELNALINSEIEKAGKKEPFERPFELRNFNGDVIFITDPKSVYRVVDAKGATITAWLSIEAAQYLCALLNRE